MENYVHLIRADGAKSISNAINEIDNTVELTVDYISPETKQKIQQELGGDVKFIIDPNAVN
ncbi:tetrahydromethanopterin S-methyltransferase subunit G [Paenibacillus sp. PvP091]|nr:tetrahydromethanopterin S-methyltransferase subunit G [Paenibacillus sp. PvP091]